jgi:hypothetical protein
MTFTKFISSDKIYLWIKKISMKRRWVYFFFLLITGNLFSQNVKNEYRFITSIVHSLAKKLTASSSIGFVMNAEKNLNEYEIGFPGLIYSAAKWLQICAGLDDVYTNNWDSENTNELRPYMGIKFLIPNTAKVHLYNFTQYEYRHIKKTETKSVHEYGRIRNRFGAEIPLNKNPWSPKTFYVLSDLEPFYRFDKNMVDVIRIRAGSGFVINEYFRLEGIWRLQLARADKTDPFTYTDNTFRVNLKIATRKGLFKELLHPDF